MTADRDNGMRARLPARILIGVVLGSILVTSVVVGAGTAQALTSTTHPQLSLNHLIHTSPFPGTLTRVFDNEGSAYVEDDGRVVDGRRSSPTPCSRSTARRGHCGE